jgi:hypothetical protein
LGSSLCGRSFIIFVVVAFVFAWSQSQLDEWVSWLPKPILMLLEGGIAWVWHCLGLALLEGDTAWGWRCSGVALVVYMDRQSTEYLLICLNQYSCCLRVALLEGGTARGWCCLREALLEGDAARGWRWLFTWIEDPRNICRSLLNIDATRWWLIGVY